MRQIELEGKTYTLKGRMGKMVKLLKKYDILSLQNGGWGDDDMIYTNFLLESAWKLIQPNRLFKPFIFFFIFKKRVVLQEVLDGKNNIMGILYGLSEDRQAEVFDLDDIEDEDEEEKKSEETTKAS